MWSSQLRARRQRTRLLVRVPLLGLLVGACAGDASDGETTSAGTSTEASVANGPSTVPPFEALAGVTTLTLDIAETVPHDVLAFTQGLVFDDRGRLFESTGLEGRSTLRELDPATGEVVRTKALDDSSFGEGLALVGDRLIQITWQDETAFVYDIETFEQQATFGYEGDGWGLCYDGARLVMSDGTDTLTFRDPETFEVTGEIAVTMAGAELALLNELECVDGKVYANLYRSDLIAIIDPSNGVVETLIDAAKLPRQDGAEVMNGIAVDPEGDLWLTGKLWDSMYRVELVPR